MEDAPFDLRQRLAFAVRYRDRPDVVAIDVEVPVLVDAVCVACHCADALEEDSLFVFHVAMSIREGTDVLRRIVGHKVTARGRKRNPQVEADRQRRRAIVEYDVLLGQLSAAGCPAEHERREEEDSPEKGALSWRRNLRACFLRHAITSQSNHKALQY